MLHSCKMKILQSVGQPGAEGGDLGGTHHTHEITAANKPGRERKCSQGKDTLQERVGRRCGQVSKKTREEKQEPKNEKKTADTRREEKGVSARNAEWEGGENFIPQGRKGERGVGVTNTEKKRGGTESVWDSYRNKRVGRRD